jgi:hypothetical protein
VGSNLATNASPLFGAAALVVWKAPTVVGNVDELVRPVRYAWPVESSAMARASVWLVVPPR